MRGQQVGGVDCTLKGAVNELIFMRCARVAMDVYLTNDSSYKQAVCYIVMSA